MTNQTISRLWKVLWHMDILPKVKNFIWRLLHNALPLGANLLKRKLSVDALCKFYPQLLETSDHGFSFFMPICYGSLERGRVLEGY